MQHSNAVQCRTQSEADMLGDDGGETTKRICFPSFSHHICSDRKVKTAQSGMCSPRQHSLVRCGVSVCDISVAKWTDTLCLDARMQQGCAISSARTARICHVFYIHKSWSACVQKPFTIANFSQFSQSSVTCRVISHSLRSQCAIMRVDTYISSTWRMWRCTELDYRE